jgi:hypothetical protein
MIAAAVLAGQLATTYPSGSYIDDIRQTVVIVWKEHVTVEHGGYSPSYNVKYTRLRDGVIQFKYGGKTYRAALLSNGKLDVYSTSTKGTYSGIYAH